MNIKELKLNTLNFEKQILFYSEIIGLDLVSKTNIEVKFKIGKSILCLVKSSNFQPYHFAINIPSNKEEQALQWLKERVTILKDGASEIQEFDFWNARAIYFYDEDKNIVELIARRNMNNSSNHEFSNDALLEISEIGVPVSDIESTFNSLFEMTNIPKFDGGFERFLAVGDENGLFICINKNLKDWFPTNDKALPAPFKINFLENELEYFLEFKNEKIQPLTNIR